MNLLLKDSDTTATDIRVLSRVIETIRSSTHLLSFVSLQTANALSTLRVDEQKKVNETDNIRQTTSDRQPQTDDLRQTTSDRRPQMDNIRQTTSDGQWNIEPGPQTLDVGLLLTFSPRGPGYPIVPWGPLGP